MKPFILFFVLSLFSGFAFGQNLNIRTNVQWVKKSPHNNETISNFKCYVKNYGVHLKWSAKMQQFGTFEICRKTKDSEFKAIKSFEAPASTSDVINYEYTDNTVEGGKEYFYCLKLIYNNDNFMLSEIINCVIEESFVKPTIVASEDGKTIIIQNVKDFKNSIISLFDENDKEVAFEHYNELNAVKIDINKLPVGKYILSFKSAQHSFKTKLLITE